ncbi:MAG TPA: coagulation factor 5/8 type domain-containing protein [Tepidisphaeraceae bacterium]
MALAGAAAIAAEPATMPDFGPNVRIFDPSMTMPAIQKQIDAIFATQEKGQFNSNRYALLFKPGNYQLDVQVGFYMQVAGLGRSPDDVAITGAVRSTARWLHGVALVNFWRSVENLCVTPTLDADANVWAVSQGTAMRRVHIKGNLNLWDGGYSSGGFLADSIIDGAVNSGSQQQWLSRNVEWSRWMGGAWNMVFVGTINPPAGEWPQRPYTVIEQTPIIREKPYLCIDSDGQFFVRAPQLQSSNSKGASWKSPTASEKMIPIDRFFIARADRDNAASINAALDAGKNLLLTPGIYLLDQSIHVSRPDTIVLGLGFPTLVPSAATPALTIADVDGVQVGGILLQAGEKESPTLLQVGERAGASHASDPIFLYDIFARAGGTGPAATRAFVTINSNNVVGDNFWLWRADHGKGAGWTSNPNRNGLIVNGADVTLYGLFIEHCQEYQTVWNGNGGRVYFYQSEMPYDPPVQAQWEHNGVRGYASYKVADSVSSHQAWGLGIYSVFHAASIVADSAIEAPTSAGVKFHHIIIKRLDGKPGSGIAHILNDEGELIIEKDTARRN